MAGVFSGIIGSLNSQAFCAQFLFVALFASGLTHTIESKNGEYWKDPCSGHPLRHARSTADHEYKYFFTQLERTLEPKLKEIYVNSTSRIYAKTQGKCPKISRLLGPIRKSKNYSTALQSFYNTLGRIAIHMRQIKNIRVSGNTLSFDKSKRVDYYNSVEQSFRLMMCEYQDSNRSERRHQAQPIELKVVAKTPRCVPPKADLTTAKTIDFYFLKTLKQAVRRGRKFLKRKLKGRNRKPLSSS